MKSLVGTLPLLPWWRLRNMSDEEVEKFNRKHLVEIEMSGDSAVEDFYVERVRMQIEIVEVERKHVWNAAIEAAAKVADDADEIAAADIRKLKK